MGLLFDTIIQELNLVEAYQKAQATYSGNVSHLVENIHNIDGGESLDNSMSNPSKFMKVTDALLSHLNAKIEEPNSDTILSILLDTEVISADSFLPHLSVTSSIEPNSVEVGLSGCILPLSLFVDGTIYDEDAEDVIEQLATSEPQLQYAGRLLVSSDSDTLQWCPYTETVEETSIIEEPTIPVSEDKDVERRRAKLEG